MSDPTPAQPSVDTVSGPAAGGPAPSKVDAQPPRRRRWIDGLTVILLSVAVAGAVGAAAVPILRAAGLGAPPELVGAHGDRGVVSPDLSEPRPHRFFAPPEEEDEGPIVTDLERRYPDGMWPGRGGRDPSAARDREKADPPRGMRAAGGTKLGLTQKPLTLFESPSEGGDVLGAVKAGELVMVMKEVGDWVLVAYNGPTDVLMGWVKKSGIAIR